MLGPSWFGVDDMVNQIKGSGGDGLSSLRDSKSLPFYQLEWFVWCKPRCMYVEVGGPFVAQRQRPTEVEPFLFLNNIRVF